MMEIGAGGEGGTRRGGAAHASIPIYDWSLGRKREGMVGERGLSFRPGNHRRRRGRSEAQSREDRRVCVETGVGVIESRR